MAQIDFAEPIPSYNAPAVPQSSAQQSSTALTIDAYPSTNNVRPVQDLFSLLKGAVQAVFDFAPGLTSQQSQSQSQSQSQTQTATTTTVTTITSNSIGQPSSFTTMTTTTTTTSVVPLGHSDHSHRSCVDFIRRLLGAGGVTELRINSLPIRSLCIEDGIDKLSFGQDTCAICLDGYENDNRVRVLGCEHVFHTACIDPWLRRGRPTCPLCQTICC